MNNNFNNFNNMDDLFNQLMGGMRGYSSENRRYLINGREVTPEEFTILPSNWSTSKLKGRNKLSTSIKAGNKAGILAKLGRNLTEARKVS